MATTNTPERTMGIIIEKTDKYAKNTIARVAVQVAVKSPRKS
jgi:hypothetical protein